MRRLENVCERVTHGDATDEAVLRAAGVEEAPSVLLTTSNDPMNIYLASICRRLNGDLRIVGRITHERNIDAIQRAGADLVLSYATLGVESLWALVAGRPTVVLGEGVELQRLPVPDRLAGKTLAEAEIGARTGLNVIALKEQGQDVRAAKPSLTLTAGAELVVIGSEEQLQALLEEGD